ncbi:hypothetical protein [Nocardioides sp. zg-DK7169]|uniref:hypothetical protein n=1 Tax=Nocardioides sp. zg-DK7169 TaxID=2736600 RepID=UPI001557E040|nr:hypothetical protein [Nocardioides sp. zg-DK7169]NPC98916.1 hypothetical protein [Nocardioides sp. zg-DK7169]
MRARRVAWWLAVWGTALATTACTGDGAGQELGNDREGASISELSEKTLEPVVEDDRPFAAPTSDAPSGPSHSKPVPAEPTADELAEAAQGPFDRYGAEVFALTLSHAMEDQTEGTGPELFEQYLATDLPELAARIISDARRWPGNRTAPGETAWVRSQASGEQDNTFVVHLIELVESPRLNIDGEPFYFWSSNLLTVAHGAAGWQLVDFQQQLASEKRDFRPPKKGAWRPAKVR